MRETIQDYPLGPRAQKWLAIGLLVGTLLYIAVSILTPLDLPGWLPLVVMGAVWWGLLILAKVRTRRNR